MGDGWTDELFHLEFHLVCASRDGCAATLEGDQATTATAAMRENEGMAEDENTY